ncbi:DEAD/DEAH box helicase [Chitinophaga sp. SYP-B3965]|uniref:DEAD/DEAH box helicase n=1 Tax=Chitinophaga sp. SYP-B3965 TaxID=2663120 RepID=UPI001299A6E9|nr:DEAD/DEAH box helicase [Chitinophaga sp. SYP-B3965]MRG43494.1 DEAD/DEAH box helicase [Chitinophaga sp. SYP-B3965]
MTFEDLNLNKPLLAALKDLNFTTPTTIQSRVFSVTMSGRDVCGIAQTGTGKTFAYLLPCLRMWTFTKDRFPQILIVVPTRELVVQVVESVKKLSTHQSVEVAGFYGGANMNPQMAVAEGKLDVVVATPGRLVDIVLSGALKLKAIKRLVIDEVDEMLNLGFRAQLKNILDLLPLKRQNLLFSATITPDVEELIKTFFNNPDYIEAAPVGTPLANITQKAYMVPNFYTKVNLLGLLLREETEMTKVLVFASTKKLADELYEPLALEFPEKVGVIHSNKEQNHRFNTVKQFQSGNYSLLIATDIIARGLDISEVTHVINFDMPEQPESYIHRIGRTGRFDKKGIAISFITEKDKEVQDKIEALMNYQIPVAELPENLEISTELTPEEEPGFIVPNIVLKQRKREDVGTAFHDKAAHNQKKNVKVRHSEKMKQKYGKPKTRGAKPKGKN